MRLVCPNCGAQYEVEDRVIPEGGRDVQCSNCGHAWFQRNAGRRETPPDHDPDSALAAPENPHEYTPDPDEDWDEPPVDTPARPRRPLDDDVRGILTEEAQRELDARARDGGTVETQAELGIEDYSDGEEERRRIARERMARMRGIEEGETLEPEVPPPPPPEPAARKDMFPDIDEINSTLDTRQKDESKPKRQPVQEDTSGPEPRKGGFRRGFSIVVIIAAIAFGIYVLAPRIAEMFPGLTDAMIAYVDLVNRFLAWIQDLMQTVIDRVEGAASDGG
ncbi:zinc-ribbon domain-containing protein [Maritimibacter sp. UBA3975]|uniref:zinc-ribbon domain-containing protein n=1 Tax=Maritimibacter sp. UBA3975 TaxID=1946833 RepID=UPI000C09B8CB|nr:zinc-ribbon domain-containing protein [Maritimibacter sp. UBA3975]MAM61953.1 hypothetical protein [Maritimibacter sp.]|tara:strand:- start:14801 stop:15634 length:834 start_codon:yes stop_codon:yes gene_type:complete